MELAVGEIVSTHSHPKAAGDSKKIYWASTVVSTHSRPKAAGKTKSSGWPSWKSFNTQPPEGGWFKDTHLRFDSDVSTHSRPKAAGESFILCNQKH